MEKFTPMAKILRCREIESDTFNIVTQDEDTDDHVFIF